MSTFHLKIAQHMTVAKLYQSGLITLQSSDLILQETMIIFYQRWTKKQNYQCRQIKTWLVFCCGARLNRMMQKRFPLMFISKNMRASVGGGCYLISWLSHVSTLLLKLHFFVVWTLYWNLEFQLACASILESSTVRTFPKPGTSNTKVLCPGWSECSILSPQANIYRYYY